MDESAHKKLDFLVIGTQKGGTTSLDRYLRLHPDIIMPIKKELHFFDSEQNYRQGEQNYHRFFQTESKVQIKGECTPIYMYWHHAIERIYHYNPKMKLVIALRNPMWRAWSHWNMESRRGYEPVCFAEALQLEAKRLGSCPHYQHRVFSYMDRGYYARQLKRILLFFPKEQLFIFRSEDLKKQPKKILDKLFFFLQVSNFSIDLKYELHQGNYSNLMQRKHFDIILRELKDDISELESLLFWDCSSWYKFDDCNLQETQPRLVDI